MSEQLKQTETNACTTQHKIKFIIKRDGAVTEFQEYHISKSITSAMQAIQEPDKTCNTSSTSCTEDIPLLISDIMNTYITSGPQNPEVIELECLQDLVEQTLMKHHMHDVARAYIAHRTKRAIARELSAFKILIKFHDDTEPMVWTSLQILKHVEHILTHGKHLIDSELSFPQLLDRISSALIRELNCKPYDDTKNFVLEDTFDEYIARVMMQYGCFNIWKQYIITKNNPSSTTLSTKNQQSHHTSLPSTKNKSNQICVNGPSGEPMVIMPYFIKTLLERAFKNSIHAPSISKDDILTELHSYTKTIFSKLYDNMSFHDVIYTIVTTLRHLAERAPIYSYILAQILLDFIYYSASKIHLADSKCHRKLNRGFKSYLAEGIEHDMLTPCLLSDFNLYALEEALDFSRDNKFKLIGLQTICDRYLLKSNGILIETPQYMWMRVAMGLALNEPSCEERTHWAIKFYNVFSQMKYMPSTPTLFNSGTTRPQLSSCYVSTTEDSLEQIFKTISDNAHLSKWAGGIGNDWSSVRSAGSKIMGTNGNSNGIVPFLKVVNATTVAVNQGGKRNGSTAVSIEIWHLDIDHFLVLRKNTGDERLRTHDLHTMLWIPDLFFERVLSGGSWTLFCPSECPDLHEIYGESFKIKYEQYEALAEHGQISLFKKVNALEFWRRILSLSYETGHPWFTFKDAANIRNPQKHVGTIHGSNLCTEVFLNTSKDETAVCNLGSINLYEHTTNDNIDWDELQSSVHIAIRALDNVIENGFYPIPSAENAAKKHRAVGLGMCGLADTFLKIGISFNNSECIEHSDILTEFISYHAILASSTLAKERGSYSSFDGSTWSQGILPIDTWKQLKTLRAPYSKDMDDTCRLDWDNVRKIVKAGMRNCTLMAIAPTVTISNIMGVMDSIAPIYGVIFNKSNLSGSFICMCDEAYNVLVKHNLWTPELSETIKYYDGSVKHIKSIPDKLKNILSTAFETPATLLVQAASRRQKWIDQGQSLNLFFASTDGNHFQKTFEYAWSVGLKSTYYPKQLEASQIEKATINLNSYSLRPRWMKSTSATDLITLKAPSPTDMNTEVMSPISCLINNETCTACQ